MRPPTVAHLVIAVGLFVLAAFLTVGTLFNLWPHPPVATIAFISGLPISAGLAWLVLEARDRGLPFSKALRFGWGYQHDRRQLPTVAFSPPQPGA
jgi:hypothetical protein